MTGQVQGIVIGGLLPALFFGISGVFAKAATQGTTIGTGLYMVLVGLAAALVGLMVHLVDPGKVVSWRSGVFTSLVGVTWGIAAGLVAFALTKYRTPIATLVPLYNMNTLVAVVIGLFWFAEWKEVNTFRLVVGSICIVVGGSLVATSVAAPAAGGP
jgi:transporter family protein